MSDTREIIQEVSGFYPLFEELLKQYDDLITPAVFGVAWRYCQMKDGVCRASLRTIADILNISEATVMRRLEALCNDGYLIDTTPDARNTPHVYADAGRVIMKSHLGVVETVSHRNTTKSASRRNTTVSQGNETVSESQLIKDSIKDSNKERLEFLKTLGLDWLIAAGQEVTQDVIDKAVREKNATGDFEKVFGFGTLPWSSNSAWTKFQKFVVKIYSADPAVFADYVAWRKDAGKYTAFSNKKIRENPAAFMDTGYPEFEASKMYSPGKPAIDEKNIEETKRLIEQKHSGEFVPRPETVPPPTWVKEHVAQIAKRRSIRK